MESVMTDREVWFVTGSQHLYGPDVLRPRRGGRAEGSPRASTRRPQVPIRVVVKPVVSSPESIEGVLLDADRVGQCVGVIAWMHTFSPARMWIAGLTDAAKAARPSPHPVQPGPALVAIDMDFMNVNQSAHGDREFGFIQTRLARAGVVGHWQDRRCDEIGFGPARPPAGTRRTGSDRPLRRQHARGRGHRGDKVEAQVRLGFAVNGYGVTDSSGPSSR